MCIATLFVDSYKMANVHESFHRNVVADSLDPNASEGTENYGMNIPLESLQIL